MRIYFPCVFLLLSFLGLSQKKVSLEFKIGQMIMIGLPNNRADTGSPLFKDVQAGKIGGITLYERLLTPANAEENLRLLVKFYQDAAPNPLFVSITQEGGLVNRLKTKYGFLPMPSASYLGGLNSLDTTKYYADNIAFTLSRLGINVNFAPVVDVYSPTNPVLGSRERTFSADPAVITKHAEQMILSHDYFNVATVLKHFPGHGSSTKDTHIELTDVSKTWKQNELRPYKDLLQKGLVGAIMTAHIVNTQLDKDSVPATLSKKILTDLLRKKLKFKGVVFSDDMQMKAISAEYSLKESIEKAINAGVDVLLFSGNISGQSALNGSDIVNIILELIGERKISNERIEASYQRITRMKSRF